MDRYLHDSDSASAADSPASGPSGSDLVTLTPAGLWVPDAGVHIDPWGPSPRAVVTHGHADHARGTARRILAAPSSEGILRARLGDGPRLELLPFGERLRVGGAVLSLHPAGHILGSAQLRIEARGQVWVVTGDCKRQPDPAAEPFEVVACDVLICECTFGLPVYRWPDPETVIDDLLAWWQGCAAEGRTAFLGAYALGKAQRVLAHLALRAPEGGEPLPGPILVHGSVDRLLPAYRAAGIPLPPVARATRERVRAASGRALVIAPPSTASTPWARALEPFSLGVASGWMRIRGTRRRRGADRGFVLSDHLDWPDLLRTVKETGARRLGLTHGATGPAVRYFRQQGIEAWSLETRFEGESGSDGGDLAPVEGREGDGVTRHDGREASEVRDAPETLKPGSPPR